ncbi:MAG: family 10 glycosylhydrolase [Gemmatimonadetes bacterium]|nr:family 10 glycosylhydrolase [Gemmatimonadota bacterium]
MSAAAPPRGRERNRLRTAASIISTLLLATCSRATPPTKPKPVPLGTPVPETPTLEAPRPVVLPAPLPPVEREFRGVWVATVENLDWPSRPGLPTEEQKAQLLSILDRAAALNLNAIIFQVRPAADAFYASSLEPWSHWLTGEQGRAPEPLWDPLAFAVEEAHRRGLELHAWFNPYRAGYISPRWHAAPTHITRTHPELVRRYGHYLWLDPGMVETRNHAMRVVLDVVRRYDIDGVQIDDYFYPYLERGRNGKYLPFPDDATYRRYREQGGDLDLGDWRRENVNILVRQLYDAIKATKPWVKFGISPFGIWRPGHPSDVDGLDSYTEIFADSKKWLNNGWLDYLAPQLYWKTDAPRQRYTSLLAWWEAQNAHARHIWPGNFTSRVGGRGPSAWSADEIVRQVDLTRRSDGASGNIHFSARALMDNAGGIADRLRQLYREPALVPESPWLGAARPGAPRVTLEDAGDDESYVLRVEPADTVVPRFWVVRIYDQTGGWTTRIASGDARTLRLTGDYLPPYTVAVSEVSRTGVEGPVAAATTVDADRRVGVK